MTEAGAAGDGTAQNTAPDSSPIRIQNAEDYLQYASDHDNVWNLPAKSNRRRSGCPVSISLEILGDRWSLLIIRDLMVRGFRSFKEFQGSGERIASNILADRLQKLETSGIVKASAEGTDARKVNYRLTRKGIDLAPVLLELLIWGARHEKTAAPGALIARLEQNRDNFLAEVRRRWRERDLTPMMPRFGNGNGSPSLTKKGERH
jgi:DNA-binding HxlR family transcriptional regulator